MRIRVSRLTSGAAFILAALCGNVVHAQQVAPQAMGADGSVGAGFLPMRANIGEPGGVKLSESAVLHAGIGFEAGYDTNVFFDRGSRRIASPLVRVIPFLQLTNAIRGGARPNGMFYDLSATLLYREFITDDTRAKAQRAFNPVIAGVVELSPNSPIRLTLSDTFSRFEEPPYGAGTGNITRINNLGSIQAAIVPGGGRIQTMVRYSNTLNVFENDNLRYGNHMGHDLTLDVSWRWLPKTALFFQASQGYIHYFNPREGLPRQNAYPLRLMTGIRGLITNKTTLYLGVGYINGFYQGGAKNPNGFSNLGLTAEVSYAPTMLTRVALGFRHEFRNSPIIGNYYDVDTPYVSVSALLASRLLWGAFGRYEYRRYHGVGAINTAFTTEERKDHVFQGGTQLDLFVSHWFYVGASYIATVNDSNYGDIPAFQDAAGLEYVKHLILGRLGVTY